MADDLVQVGCEDCGAPYGKDGWCDAVIPDAIWNSLGAGLLCFRCMTKRLDGSYEDVPVLIASGPYKDSQETWRLLGWDHGYKVGKEEAADALARKDAEIAELRRDIERLMDPNIVAMSIRDGGLDMNLEGTACRLLAESFASDFQKGGGTNYIECRFTSQEVMPGEAIVVTVQRINGKTPSQCRAEAEAERDEQRQRAERAEARVREAPVLRGATLASLVGAAISHTDAKSRFALVRLDTEEAK